MTDALREYAPGLLADVQVLAARHATLPFYSDEPELFDLQIAGAQEVERAFVVLDNGSLTWLDGTSTPIHDLNETASISLGEDVALDYVRWFLFGVRSDMGPFVLRAPIRLGGAVNRAERVAEAS